MLRLSVDADHEFNAILAIASNEARRLGEWQIDASHLLAALAAYRAGKAAALLATHGVTADAVRRLAVLLQPRILIDVDDDDALAWLGIDARAVREVLRTQLDLDAFDPAPELNEPYPLTAPVYNLMDVAHKITAQLKQVRPEASLRVLAAILTNRWGSGPALLMQRLGIDLHRLRVAALGALGVEPNDIEAVIGSLDSFALDPLWLLEQHAAKTYLDVEAAARVHELDPDTPRAVRVARILHSLASAVEDAAAKRARTHGWSEADVDGILHRVHVLEWQTAVQVAFTRAIASDDELDDRLGDLVTRGTPLAFTSSDVRARIERRLLDDGFSLVDAARGADRGWTFAESTVREAVIFGAGVEGELPTISMSSGPTPKVPRWSGGASDRMINGAMQLAATLKTGTRRNRDVFDTVHDSPVLIRIGGMVTLANPPVAGSKGRHA